MRTTAKFLTILLCLAVIFSLVSAHANHSHEEENKNGFSGLMGEYSSSAAVLGVVEVVLGIMVVTLSYNHYRKES